MDEVVKGRRERNDRIIEFEGRSHGIFWSKRRNIDDSRLGGGPLEEWRHLLLGGGRLQEH